MRKIGRAGAGGWGGACAECVGGKEGEGCGEGGCFEGM